MDRLFRKQFIYQIELKKKFLFFPYTKKIVLEYQEATIWDTIIYRKLKEEQIVSYILEFIKIHSKEKIKKSDYMYLLLYMTDIIEHLNKTFIRPKDDVRTPPPWDPKDKAKPSIDSAYFVWLAKELWLECIYMMKNYTPAQIEFMVEWMCRNTNNMSDDWVSRNKSRLKNKWKPKSQEEIQKINTILSKIS